MCSTRETTKRFKLQLSDGEHEVAYLQLPSYPVRKDWRTSKSVRLFDLIGKYQGPDIVLDFDDDGVLVGIEVLA